jgi:hypothetical protein
MELTIMSSTCKGCRDGMSMSDVGVGTTLVPGDKVVELVHDEGIAPE